MQFALPAPYEDSGACAGRSSLQICMRVVVTALCASARRVGVARRAWTQMATAIAIYGHIYVTVMQFALPAPHEESGACAG